jgi:hypothetical protein
MKRQGTWGAYCREYNQLRWLGVPKPWAFNMAAWKFRGFYPVPNRENYTVPDETTEYCWTETTINPSEALFWAAENLPRKKVPPEESPSGTAYALYVAYRGTPELQRNFFEKLWLRAIGGAKVQIEPGETDDDDATKTINKLMKFDGKDG